MNACPSMTARVLYDGMTHWVQRIKVDVTWLNGLSTREPFVGFLCTGLLHPEKSVVFVCDDVDCMSCLVAWVREGGPYVRFR